mmetsp:Transcript_12834/g.35005  ORF Transcript_12834/g.35005 Transcript_12834/m.35005 type:complete len:225 (-) Transcript_12834:1355-2029(-)
MPPHLMCVEPQRTSPPWRSTPPNTSCVRKAEAPCVGLATHLPRHRACVSSCVLFCKRSRLGAQWSLGGFILNADAPWGPCGAERLREPSSILAVPTSHQRGPCPGLRKVHAAASRAAPVPGTPTALLLIRSWVLWESAAAAADDDRMLSSIARCSKHVYTLLHALLLPATWRACAQQVVHRLPQAALSPHQLTTTIPSPDFVRPIALLCSHSPTTRCSVPQKHR